MEEDSRRHQLVHQHWRQEIIQVYKVRHLWVLCQHLRRGSKESQGFHNHFRARWKDCSTCETVFPVPQGYTLGEENNSFFDVTMGSFDGAECCETLGLYILHHLTTVYNLFSPLSLGLYRDDGLAIMKGNTQELDDMRKKITKTFK